MHHLVAFTARPTPLTRSCVHNCAAFCVLQAVELFLDGQCSYLDIARLIERTCERHQSDLVTEPSLDEIVHYDLWARSYVAEQVAESKLIAA